MSEILKIKQLSKSQVLISLDRLTRFKPTEEKYLRVFKDIITSNLINPKFKKHEIDEMNYEKNAEIVERIFEFTLNSRANDISINKKLLEYERNIFKFDKNVERLVNNKIDYKSAIEFTKNEEGICKNLLWLKALVNDKNPISIRQNKSLGFPVEKIVLVEGITEEILLSEFAKLCGINFDKEGIHLISAGGKNQVVRLFYQYAEILKLPIFVLLDKDAQNNYEEIKPKLRNCDKVHVLNCGEFEDLLPLNLIKRTINNKYKNYFQIGINDLRKDLPMTRTLEPLLKEHGFEFKKAEFAALIKDNLIKTDISEELNEISKEIKTL